MSEALSIIAQIRQMQHRLPAEGADVQATRAFQEVLADARFVVLSRSALMTLAEDTSDYACAVPGHTPVWSPHLPFPVTCFVVSRPILVAGMEVLGLMLTEERMSLFAGRETGRAYEIEIVSVVEAGQLVDADMAVGARALMFTGLALGMACDHAASVLVKQTVSPAHYRKMQRGRPAPDAPIPRDYYRVDIRDRLWWQGATRQSIVAYGPTYTVAHRHDVRSHPRILVERRPVEELTAKRYRSLTKRGYVVWTGREDDPTDDDLEHMLFRRGVRRREGEYLAALLIRVKAHIRGDATRPYVPAAWRLHMTPSTIQE